MPTIIVDKNKGLFQKAATTANKAGTLSGQLEAVKTCDGDTTLTLADSGKLFLVGGTAGTIQFPVTDAGWHGTFVITGSIVGDILLSGSSASTESAVSLVGTIVSGDGSPSGQLITGVTDIRFDKSGDETAGDSIEIKVVAANSTIVAKGNVAT